MINRRNAMIGTILLGLFGAVGYYLGQTLFGRIHGSLNFSAGIWWLLLAGYGLSLSWWAGKSILDGVYPLALPVIALAFGGSQIVFLGLVIGVLSWLRSGLYFRQGFRGVWLEALLSGGGLVLMLGLTPHHFLSPWNQGATLHQALGIWLFFLVQSVYFIMSPLGSGRSDETRPRDRFEEARRRAEEILSGQAI